MNKALVTKLIGGLYTFKDLKTGVSYEGYARGKFRKTRVEKDSSFNKNLTKRTKKEVKDIVLSPKVGDIATYEFSADQYMITGLDKRKNELSRPDVANVDQVLLVFSCVRPDFSFTLLDKFLVILSYNHLVPVIVVSKIDLIDKEALNILKKELATYHENYEIHYVDSKQKIGFDVLETIFENKITVLAGQTGVGKSTLMNALLPQLNLKTQEISMALGRGKHTTRHSQIYEFGGGYIADTPGFSKIEFEFHEYTVIKEHFVEFKHIEHLCRFGNNCYHLSEPGCMIKTYVEENKLLKSRYESYLNFVEELRQKKERY